MDTDIVDANIIINCLVSRRHSFYTTYKITMLRYFYATHRNNHDKHFYKTFQANRKRSTIKETDGKENIQFSKGYKRHPKTHSYGTNVLITIR